MNCYWNMKFFYEDKLYTFLQIMRQTQFTSQLLQNMATMQISELISNKFNIDSLYLRKISRQRKETLQ
jgi:hypothetical protein